jgi:hypothetical protein
MKLKKILKLFDYKISDGSEFQWGCFGPNARYLDFNSDTCIQNSVSVLYDTITTKVYQMDFCCESVEGVYTWVDPKYEVAHARECLRRGIEGNKYQCYSKESFLTMALDAYHGRTPDTDLALDVDVDLSAGDIHQLHLIAESKGITFDELVNEVLAQELEILKNKKE